MNRLFGVHDSEQERKISMMDVTSLREALNAGELTSVRLVQILARKCFVTGRANNYTTYERFEEAMAEA